MCVLLLNGLDLNLFGTNHLPLQQQIYCIFQVTGIFQPPSFDEEFDPEGSKAGGLNRLIAHKHLMWASSLDWLKYYWKHSLILALRRSH